MDTEIGGLTMYDELVKTIRKQCSDMDCGNCNTCVKLKAADAIEELFTYVQMLEKLCKDGWYLQKTKMMTYGQATMTMPLPEPPKGES